MITFERWLAYCSHVTDDGQPGEHFGPDREGVETLPPTTAASYLTQLLRSLDAVARLSGRDQLARILWFVFGENPGYLRTILSDEVPADLQIELLRAFRDAYPAVWDELCCASGTDPDGRYYDREPLDIAVYMLWDIGGFTDERVIRGRPHLEALVWDGVTAALSCRTSTCVLSGLHALGHMHRDSGEQVVQLVDAALATRNWPPWVGDYARLARTGDVQ